MTAAQKELALHLDALDHTLALLGEARRSLLLRELIDSEDETLETVTLHLHTLRSTLLAKNHDKDPRECPDCGSRLTARTYTNDGDFEIPTYCDECDREVQ